MLQKPTSDSWGTALDAFRTALELEHQVNDKLLDLHWLGQHRNDPHVRQFLNMISHFLRRRVKVSVPTKGIDNILDAGQGGPDDCMGHCYGYD